MRRRVVITGRGCVTPLVGNVETMWAGCSWPGGRITLFDATNFPDANRRRNPRLERRLRLDRPSGRVRRHTQFAAAAQQAVADAGIEGHVNPTRFGVYLEAARGNRISTPSAA